MDTPFLFSLLKWKKVKNIVYPNVVVNAPLGHSLPNKKKREKKSISVLLALFIYLFGVEGAASPAAGHALESKQDLMSGMFQYKLN